MRVMEQIGKMNGARGFAADHFDDAWMGMTERVDGDPPEKIEIFFSRGIIDTAIAPMGENNGRALVGRQKILVRITQSRIHFGEDRLLPRMLSGMAACSSRFCFSFHSAVAIAL
ncbi:MAG: hypothetical protein NVS9B13_12230 [Candidatus Acidiferrum sp.]